MNPTPIRKGNVKQYLIITIFNQKTFNSCICSNLCVFEGYIPSSITAVDLSHV